MSHLNAAPRPEAQRSHEEIFISHYQWLMRWALQFTGNDHNSAEDLVQEVFAQFTFAQTDLAAVQNIEAYLYATLRNIHMSEVRLAARCRISPLPIVEYSLADVGLRASDPHTLLQVQDDLRRICQYAILRTRSSRSGSVLILRFFHGYHLSEVAAVLGSNHQAVRQCLRFARREARHFLNNPDALTFIDKAHVPGITSTGTIRKPDDLLTELRRAIFESCQGACSPIESLRVLYQTGEIESADKATLAHLVSCQRCLDEVNKELGFPLLVERHPADVIGPDTSSRGGPGDSGSTGGSGSIDRRQLPRGGSSGGISKAFLLRCRRRARELFEHQPRELCVSVNGHLLTSQSVGSEVSTLRLDITISEPLSFIEVMSEENARLLVMPVEEPPRGTPTQSTQVTLSDGRHLEATLRYRYPWPTLEVIYHDPNFTRDEQLSPLSSDEVKVPSPVQQTSGETEKIESVTLLDQPQVTDDLTAPSRGSLKSSLRRLIFSPLRRKRSNDTTASPSPLEKASTTREAESVSPAPEHQAVQSKPATKAVKDSYEAAEVIKLGRASDLIRGPFWADPKFITAILSVFIIAGLILVRTRVTTITEMSATTLLSQSTAAEATLAGKPDQVLHRAINLEERSAGGELLGRRRIEAWQSAEKGITVHRLYDERNKLLAGDWRRSDGVQTIYHHRARPQLQLVPEKRGDGAPLSFESMWQLSPSAKEFTALVGHERQARVEQRPATYTISYQNEGSADARGLVKATLVVSRADLRAVEQTLLVERNGETREYRFVEASFEQLPANAVAPAVFEPEAEFLSEGMKAEGGGMKTEVESKSQPIHPSSLIPHPSVVASAELEIELAYLLDQFRTRFGDQVNLTRTPDRALRVEGVVDTEQSKGEILRALSPVINNPAVKVEINTVAEALERQQSRPSAPVIVREFAGSDDTIPVYPELRKYFSGVRDSRRDSSSTAGAAPEDGRTDEAVRGFAARMVSRSRRALSHAIELKRLAERFSADELHTLKPDARAKWLALVRQHAGAFLRESSLIRQEIQPIFSPTETSNAASERIEISGDADLARAVERLYELGLANDEAVRSAFAVSSQVSTGSAIKSSQFWLSLSTAEKLADGIRQAAVRN